ncbi:MAG: RNA recognition motif domain-containing protein [Planctomycetota bacterium]|jgi:RNA recognition motif-containing protein
MNIFVGNLPWSFADSTLRDLFAAYGQVDRAKVITDRDTGRSRGFGFVEMANDEEANAAIAALNDTEHDGRPLRVNQAEERKPRAPREGGGGGYGGGGGGYGGDRGGYGGGDRGGYGGGRDRY